MAQKNIIFVALLLKLFHLLEIESFFLDERCEPLIHVIQLTLLPFLPPLQSFLVLADTFDDVGELLEELFLPGRSGHGSLEVVVDRFQNVHLLLQVTPLIFECVVQGVELLRLPGAMSRRETVLGETQKLKKH